MAFIAQLHASLANTMILFMLVCGVWGVAQSFRGGLSPSLTGALVLGEGLVLVQGLLGIAGYLGGARPAVGLHWLYGASAAVTLPGIYGAVRNRSANFQALWLGAGALFIVGLSLRGITTGRGG